MKEIELLVTLLENNSNNEFSNEILGQVRNEEILFSHGTTLKTDHALKTYSSRADMQIQVYKKEYVLGYGHLLSELSSTDLEKVCISRLSYGSLSYAIFTDMNFQALLGILRSETKGLDEQKAILKMCKEKGYPSNTIRIVKGIVKPIS